MITPRIRADWLALLVVLAAALGLSGCGRKGPLDPPPSALTNSQPTGGPGAQPPIQRPSLGEEGNGLVPSLEPLERSQRAQAAAAPPPQPPKTSFFLDFLLNK
jgi:predicted small lipoprotein YifL